MNCWRSKCFPLVLFLPVLVSCGGSGGGGNGDVSATIDKATTALNEAISYSQQNQDPSSSLSKSVQLFESAYNSNSSDPRGALGYAIAEAGVIGYAGAQEFGGTESEAAYRRLIVWKGATTLGVGKAQTTVKSLVPMFQSYSPLATTSITYAQVKSFIVDQVEPNLKTIISRLTDSRIKALDSNPLVLTYTDGGSTASYKVGTAEAYAIRAAAQGVLALADGALAYNLEPGSFNFSAYFEETFRTRLQANGTITASELVPSEFLSLNSDGNSRLTDLKTRANAILTDTRAGVQTIQSRTTTGFILDSSNLGDTDLSEVLSGLDTASGYINGTGPIQITLPSGDTVTVTLNLPALTDGDAPTSWVAYVPSISSTYDATYQLYSIATVPGSVTDKTIGGLFPNGLPDDYFTNSASFSVGDEAPLSYAFLWASGLVNNVQSLASTKKVGFQPKTRL